jgi:Tfp pilus assembly protein PilZ
MRDFRLVADSIENLSLGGLLVGPSDPILTGEPLFLSFRLPRSGQWIDTEAVVARVVHGRRDGDKTRQIGVKFDRLGQDARAAIRQQIQNAPPTPPTPRPGRRDAGPALHRLSMGSGWIRSAAGHVLTRWWDR